MCFPDKKGTLSVEGGEVNVVNVRRPLLPPSTREPIYYLTPNEVDIIPPLHEDISKWRNVGLYLNGCNYLPKVLFCTRTGISP
jgi:hypothetical protein